MTRQLLETPVRRWQLTSHGADPRSVQELAREIRLAGMVAQVQPAEPPPKNQLNPTIVLETDQSLNESLDFRVNTPTAAHATCTVKVKQASRASFHRG